MTAASVIARGDAVVFADRHVSVVPEGPGVSVHQEDQPDGRMQGSRWASQARDARLEQGLAGLLELVAGEL